MDALVYPRKSMRLTELVTPLKPLEAMAMGKIVTGSDVGGIRELVTDGKDGFLFRAGQPRELTGLLVRLASGKKGLSKVSKAAMETALTKHDWRAAISRYLPVYQGLAKKELVCVG
jgi:glycosyltransferase involved in cell wall biosynthesis